MENPHHPHNYFLLQEQKHQDIHWKNLTPITTLANSITFSAKTHILENVASLSCGCIDFPPGITT